MHKAFLDDAESLTAIAVMSGTGRGVGISQILRRNHNKAKALVTFTVVDRDHRGQALGKWLKAAVTFEAIRRWPELTGMETMNGHTNDAMLEINRLMGFEPEVEVSTYQLRVGALPVSI
jgi:GNAT superfamily N-acetyltransferase